MKWQCIIQEEELSAAQLLQLMWRKCHHLIQEDPSSWWRNCRIWHGGNISTTKILKCYSGHRRDRRRDRQVCFTCIKAYIHVAIIRVVNHHLTKVHGEHGCERRRIVKLCTSGSAWVLWYNHVRDLIEIFFPTRILILDVGNIFSTKTLFSIMSVCCLKPVFHPWYSLNLLNCTEFQS